MGPDNSYNQPIQQYSRVRIAIAIVLALLVLGGIAWGIWAIFNRNDDKPSTTQNTTSSSSQSKPSDQKTTKPQTSNQGNTSTPKPANDAAKTPAPSTPTTSELAESGPAETIAFFVVTSVLATFIHYRVMRRRTA